jgi:heterodisulfide reductase subunit C
MSKANQAMVQKYQNDFLKEVEANVEEGNWVKMCMQCGVCSGSCPLGAAWEHPPQEIFMMIRAGKRDEVLKSESMWMCTSCYNCIVRCPRELPITHIMHGLASYAHRLGIHGRHRNRHQARVGDAASGPRHAQDRTPQPDGAVQFARHQGQERFAEDAQEGP